MGRPFRILAVWILLLAFCALQFVARWISEQGDALRFAWDESFAEIREKARKLISGEPI